MLPLIAKDLLFATKCLKIAEKAVDGQAVVKSFTWE